MADLDTDPVRLGLCALAPGEKQQCAWRPVVQSLHAQGNPRPVTQGGHA